MKGGYFMERKQGFTLAEVLITLVIIGVIAAMTLPSLLGGTNKQEIKTGLQKAVSTLSQAITLHYALTGIDFSSISGLDTSEDGSLGKFMSSRLNAKSIDGNDVTTQDGIIYYLSNITQSCTISNPCQITVDVNGRKGPNTLTESANSLNDIKDRFTLFLYGTTVSTQQVSNDATNGVQYTDTVATSFLDDCYTTSTNTCQTTEDGD